MVNLYQKSPVGISTGIVSKLWISFGGVDILTILSLSSMHSLDLSTFFFDFFNQCFVVFMHILRFMPKYQMFWC